MSNFSKPPTKAIIPVAGWGTRRLPVAKSIEKCMLPICNRPVVDYSVEECVLAGIEDIFFVVSLDFEQLRSYYLTNTPLEEYLAKRGKTEVLAEVRAISRQVNFHYVIQDPSGAYGTAVPVWNARDAIQKDEQFVVVFGDDFIFHASGEQDELVRMKAAAAEHQTAGAILGVEMDAQRMSRYASIKTKQNDQGLTLFDGLVEKPAPGTGPSNLASVSYYILNDKVFPFVEQVLQAPNEHGEHFLTDAVNDFAAAGNDMVVVPSTGQHLDGGNLEGWIEANNVVFAARKQG
ncbi:MAG TPA: sugar phosphate nucleotidyltransferase [Candidatus Saccharimonadales bacterium]|nr:sugar phosphate nucleotidyltransferase [Candidatus Saccharimonadales bacterium]